MKGIHFKIDMKNAGIGLMVILLTVIPPWLQYTVRAEECHPNANAVRDGQTVANRADVRNLPAKLMDRLILMGQRPHSTLPTQAFAEADGPSRLFQYYLLDTTKFQSNIFTKI